MSICHKIAERVVSRKLTLPDFHLPLRQVRKLDLERALRALGIEELVEAARKEDIRSIRVALAKLDSVLASPIKEQ
jgi:hypothetical protein